MLCQFFINWQLLYSLLWIGVCDWGHCFDHMLCSMINMFVVLKEWKLCNLQHKIEFGV